MSLMSVPNTRQPLYTAAQRARRDATKWTLVQGVLAPIQFVVFLISLALVLRYLSTGDGYGAANGHWSDLGKSCVWPVFTGSGFFLGRYG